MNDAYARDLDLNLLRVLVVVIEEGSVTRAASRLYLTQPAISAALARLQRAVGERLFVRQGRSLTPTARGRALFEAAREHLRGLLDAVASHDRFAPSNSEHTFRVGLSDDASLWLLPTLLGRLAEAAPRCRLVVTTVQFRNVIDALVSRQIDAAVTVADEAPRSISRRPLRTGTFVCLHDPSAHPRGLSLSLDRYLALPHVIVSYNGDLRGHVEDLLGMSRNAVCSTPRFSDVGALVEGSPRIATVPDIVAEKLLALHPTLGTEALPFALGSQPVELLWPTALEHDGAQRFLRDLVTSCATEASPSMSPRRTARPPRRPRR